MCPFPGHHTGGRQSQHSYTHKKLKLHPSTASSLVGFTASDIKKIENHFGKEG
jgi:hypothetical protein